MAYLKYKTRGDSHPMGKQKIYFACHLDDFYRYIGEITDDIFETQNCAVYYSDLEQDYTVEELVAYLSEMQLFVVPITKKLLTEKTRVIDIEIPYALKRHIPILPLLQEALLIEPFRAVFGDLQYLRKCQELDLLTKAKPGSKDFIHSSGSEEKQPPKDDLSHSFEV